MFSSKTNRFEIICNDVKKKTGDFFFLFLFANRTYRIPTPSITKVFVRPRYLNHFFILPIDYSPHQTRVQKTKTNTSVIIIIIICVVLYCSKVYYIYIYIYIPTHVYDNILIKNIVISIRSIDESARERVFLERAR